ncbi:MAG TPA: pentapeptide repeat-containing protein [Thermoanaerobaculia bacterium]|nr:pentapeptide repeat-containing protein [Thermoanaerobaculia bacterium]
MKRLTAALLFVAGAEALAQCPAPTGKDDFSRQTLTDQNFASRDLRGANFTKAVLDGAQFVNADLTGAVFAGASIRPSMKGPADFTGANLTGACFQDAVLQEPDFQFANLACADFSGTDVTAVDFGPAPKLAPESGPCRVKFTGSTIRVRQIPFRVWRYTDFTRTSFVDLTPDQFSFHGIDITGALLGEGQFAGIDFTDATLTGVVLNGSDLRGAKLDGARARASHFDRVDFRLGHAAGTDFTGARMRGMVAQDASMPGAILESAILRGSNFAGTDLREARLQRAFLAPGEGLPATELAGANLSGAKLDEAHLSFVRFRDLHMVRTTFTRVSITDTDFAGATMPGADFSGATLEGVSFRGATLENATFARASLRPSKTTGAVVDLACTQLGGANLRDLGEPPPANALTFLGAVLPDAASCRPEGGGFYCGTELAGQQRYGPTLLPRLTHPATCPPGVIQLCSGQTWLLPNWTTTACGQPEKRWTPPPPHPGPPGETVEIPDEKFRLCLSRQFFGDDRPIPAKFAATVQEINCPNMGIADVTGLEAFTSLRKLTLTANRLTSAEVFGKLKNLEILEVDANALTVLNVPLATLKSLSAANNRIQRVTGIVFPDLEYLDLSRNELAEFALESQRALFYADLSHNRLTAVGDLSHGFGTLAYLYLQNNDLTTIGTLEEAARLTRLSLGGNPKFRCDTLKVDPKVLEKSNCGKSAVTASASPPAATSPD